EFIRSKDDTARLQNFRNSWLAEPFEDQVRSLDGNALKQRIEEQREKGTLPKAGLVPKWAFALLTTVDVQKDHFYVVIRAWGKDSKSKLTARDIFSAFEKIKACGLEKGGAVEGYDDEKMQPAVMFVDAGYRPDEVYEFAENDERIVPIKGASHKQDTAIRLN